ncbi:transcription factor of the MADS box [Entomophthora muscae]|uniref:Transcription factor of the MADS box n=2 Tax=Entomophthora muscae TaxID=34485 RepID=A0ACC2UKY5_9FUNG|nr:transcription factor of the MADS box [Entomophthora muscae]KAJ9087464.1 transcription factor of the MADS box [Entomophthora muscae]
MNTLINQYTTPYTLPEYGLGQPQMQAQFPAEDKEGIFKRMEDEYSDTKDSKDNRRKIKIEYIKDKSRRHITFSKRKAGIMKKAYELSTLTGTQVLLLVVSETGLVYTFTTPKLQPLVTKTEGKNLIQSCLNQPDPQLLMEAQRNAHFQMYGDAVPPSSQSGSPPAYPFGYSYPPALLQMNQRPQFPMNSYPQFAKSQDYWPSSDMQSQSPCLSHPAHLTSPHDQNNSDLN